MHHVCQQRLGVHDKQKHNQLGFQETNRCESSFRESFGTRNSPLPLNCKNKKVQHVLQTGSTYLSIRIRTICICSNYISTPQDSLSRYCHHQQRSLFWGVEMKFEQMQIV